MKFPEKYCIAKGEDGGAYSIPFRSAILSVIASDGGGWEHVSVSLKNRCPNWEEMCFIKNLFWDNEEWVMQLHPPKSQYINNHPHCLHLWRPQAESIPMPPSEFVGIKGEYKMKPNID
jgi:hypothetical protein